MSRFSLTILPLLLALVLPVLSAILPRAPPPFKVEVLAPAVQQPLYFTSNKGTCTPAKAESPICQIKANGQYVAPFPLLISTYFLERDCLDVGKWEGGMNEG
ncbi:hypothetical protein HYFRA_00006889 [Hymenoscyphus fraxineus]|uniref:Small secreted protein n=1 Tax=Hymenoscyphus fraxineus TaxID=746836 RepID=A0A9N9KNJ7_9HELO|nr:hypothetical protein HYFRA_00006889 [Hymenoscyphus fraxineus]